MVPRAAAHPVPRQEASGMLAPSARGTWSSSVQGKACGELFQPSRDIYHPRHGTSASGTEARSKSGGLRRRRSDGECFLVREAGQPPESRSGQQDAKPSRNTRDQMQARDQNKARKKHSSPLGGQIGDAPVKCGKFLCSQGFFATIPCSCRARNCIADNQATIQIWWRHSQRIEEGNPRNAGVGGSRRNFGGMPSERVPKNTPPSVPPHAALSLARKGSDVIENKWSGREDLNLRPPGPEPDSIAW